MKTYFIINNIQDGGIWTDDYADDPDMLNHCLNQLGDDLSFETRLHIIFGPFTKNEALARVRKARRSIAANS